MTQYTASCEVECTCSLIKTYVAICRWNVPAHLSKRMWQFVGGMYLLTYQNMCGNL